MKYEGREIESSGNKYLEPGVHKVVVHAFKTGTTTNGKPYVSFTLMDESDKMVYIDFFKTDAALWRIRDFALVVGFTENDSIGDDDFLGKKLTVQVVKESYDKKDGSQGMKSVVKQFMPYDINPELGEIIEKANNDPQEPAAIEDKKNDPF